VKDKFNEAFTLSYSTDTIASARSLFIITAGQVNPEQIHKKTEENFHVIYVSLILNFNGKPMGCSAGDIVNIVREINHAIMSKK